MRFAEPSRRLLVPRTGARLSPRSPAPASGPEELHQRGQHVFPVL